MEWIKEWLKNFLGWLLDVLLYVPRKIFEWFLEAIGDVIESLPLPDFIVEYNIADLIPTDILYFLYMSGFGECLAVISAGVVFYFLRRILTLGIW